MFSFSLLYTLFMYPTVLNLYNINYNNNYLFHILFTELFSSLFITEIFKPRLFCLHATSYEAHWIPTTCRRLCLAVLYTLFMCSTILNLYNNNCNNNCLFHILFLYNYSLFYSQRRSSNHDCFIYMQLHTRLTEFLLLLVGFVLPFCPTQSV